ncbi:MAG: hypothetical protein COV47_04670 [Candidatus Diapherotrites archaeon CG11_big_fil_rev_8_21_14_0_20_37_9]|nr:MAG: hypothetical protein COV47_04670 [Candidatus Diapherotrites archaeon CG11_big_fil_rev_8_21_14_0_20_37_9]
MKYALFVGLFLLALLFGCIQQKSDGSISVNVGDAIDSPSGDNGSGGSDAGSGSGGTVSVGKVSSPIFCDDRAIISQLSNDLGSDYKITRGVPEFGKPFAQVDCFVRKDNLVKLTYTVLERNNNADALAVLDDEKRQYQEQLLAYDFDASSIGSKGYLFEQLSADGSTFRLIFVDDSNKKVVVFVKANQGVSKETVNTVGSALAKVI